MIKPDFLKCFGFVIFYLFIFCILISCKQNELDGTDGGQAMFRLLKPEQTHIDFKNTLTEGLNTNILMYEYFYNGGGVAIGDLNGDGLQDIYFTANMTDNKVYLNQGKLQFKDITDLSKLDGRFGPWKTGVTMVDINGDGKLDVFLSYSGKLNGEKRKGQLFVNQGNDSSGIPKFKEMSHEYKLDFPAYCTQSYFFDSDKDGDLDLLMVNHNAQRISILDDSSVKDMMNKTDPESGIRLLRNDSGQFNDITANSGIINTSLSYGLAAGIADVDGDGDTDIYISNDYSVPDRLYINDGRGGFTDQLPKQIGHTSFYSMGNDIADINNDAKADIYTLDMLPADNKRQKLLFGADNYEAFDLNLRVGFYYQYMRNMLHINNGNETFSEIGQLAGISNTDWSWAPLFADYDNDGWKDLFVSNGYTRDYTNMDFLKYMGDNLRDRRVMRQDLLDIVRKMPSSEMKSYFFRNKGNCVFADVSKDWGINLSSNSNGAAYADLDNDGDLDLVVNNINQVAFVYENQAKKNNKNHFLSINLKGAGQNTQGIGTKAYLYTKGKVQYLEQMPTRGFQSSVSAVLHFGLGTEKEIDSLRIIWQNGKTQIIRKIKADQSVTIRQQDAKYFYLGNTMRPTLYAEVSSPITSEKTANAVNDFKRQPLMVNPVSFSGSCIIKGDVNGDNLEDIFIGGKHSIAARLFIQNKDKTFTKVNIPAFEKDKAGEDVSALFFDANGDKKMDLYVCSGGYAELSDGDMQLQDRLYLNDGKGNFIRKPNALPNMLTSKSCVKNADLNGDGFQDLFIGGRVVPGKYPEAPRSYILINDQKGHFKDETILYNASISHIGMVTDAVFTDMNGDGKQDLIIAGEWMPITIFESEDKKLIDATDKYFNKKYSGWWNCLQVADINRDGKPDIIAGNLGTNTQCKVTEREPAEMYFKDFDDNGSIDPILCFYIQHKSYPYLTRDELLDQMSIMRGRFPDYQSYSEASISQVFTPEELKDAKILSANFLSSTCFLSTTKGALTQINLPVQAQYSPIYSISVFDYDHDGNQDLLLCGNISLPRLRFGKYDSNFGSLFKGNGKGIFSYVPQFESGFLLKGDVRGSISIGNLLLFSMNNNQIKAYRRKN